MVMKHLKRALEKLWFVRDLKPWRVRTIFELLTDFAKLINRSRLDLKKSRV